MRRSIRLFFHKMAHWEYWPYLVLYLPIYPLWLYYSWKAKSLFFFNAVNPTFKNGGFIMDSKKEIYDLIPEKYSPKTMVVNPGEDIKELSQKINFESIEFPFFVKPDIGLRGFAVKKIIDFNAWKAYHENANFNYLVQEFVKFPNVIGLFYVKHPKTSRGEVTGIVSKEFLSVKGNGSKSIKELLLENTRHQIQLKSLQKELGRDLDKVLKRDGMLTVVPYGNHARGAKFIDTSHLISEELVDAFNSICSEIKGFNFGRLDIMYNNFADLEEGRDFMIIEINGAKGEPTHIYDPKHSVLFAWKELARHISYMNKISLENKKNNGARFLGFWEGLSELISHFKHNKKIANFNENRNNLNDNTEKPQMIYHLNTQN